jgi:hypothetical protein
MYKLALSVWIYYGSAIMVRRYFKQLLSRLKMPPDILALSGGEDCNKGDNPFEPHGFSCDPLSVPHIMKSLSPGMLPVCVCILESVF